MGNSKKKPLQDTEEKGDGTDTWGWYLVCHHTEAMDGRSWARA